MQRLRDVARLLMLERRSEQAVGVVSWGRCTNRIPSPSRLILRSHWKSPMFVGSIGRSPRDPCASTLASPPSAVSQQAPRQHNLNRERIVEVSAAIRFALARWFYRAAGCPGIVGPLASLPLW